MCDVITQTEAKLVRGIKFYTHDHETYWLLSKVAEEPVFVEDSDAIIPVYIIMYTK